MSRNSSSRITVSTLALVISSTSTMAAQDDPICGAIAKPGLYIVRPSSPVPIPINGPVAYEQGSRIYVVPWFGPKEVDVDKELVWHIRMQTTARSAPHSNQVFVYRSRVQTQCTNGTNLGPGRGSWFPDFSPDERYVSLRRYNDHHPTEDSSRRIDGGLARYFHFEVSNADDGSCFKTDDSRAVGNLFTAYGFRDVPLPKPMTSPPPLVSEAQADEDQSTVFSPKYSGLASLFVHLSGPASACFSFAAPVPTSSNIYHQIVSYGRDEFAQSQGRSWKPERTDLDLHLLPKGRHFYKHIDWLNSDASLPHQ